MLMGGGGGGGGEREGRIEGGNKTGGLKVLRVDSWDIGLQEVEREGTEILLVEEGRLRRYWG